MDTTLVFLSPPPPPPSLSSSVRMTETHLYAKLFAYQSVLLHFPSSLARRRYSSLLSLWIEKIPATSRRRQLKREKKKFPEKANAASSRIMRVSCERQLAWARSEQVSPVISRLPRLHVHQFASPLCQWLASAPLSLSLSLSLLSARKSLRLALTSFYETHVPMDFSRDMKYWATKSLFYLCEWQCDHSSASWCVLFTCEETAVTIT